MTLQEADAKARSYRRTGALLMIWGLFMSGVYLFVLGAYLPPRERVFHTPSILVACVVVTTLGVGLFAAMTAALSRRAYAKRIPDVLMGVIVLFAAFSFIDTFALISGTTRPQGIALLGLTMLVMTAVGLVFLHRIKARLAEICDALLGCVSQPPPN